MLFQCIVADWRQRKVQSRWRRGKPPAPVAVWPGYPEPGHFFCCLKVVPKDYFLNWSFKRNENLSLIKNIFPRPLLLSNPHLIHQTHGVVGSGGKKLRKCYFIHIPHVPIHICLTWNLWNLGYLANLGDEKPMRQIDLISYIFSNHVKLFTWEDHKCQRR